MPVYEYRCNGCSATFELLRPMAERSVAAVCPRCEGRSTMPLISTVARGAARSGGGEPAAVRSGGGCCGGACGCGA